MNTLNQLKSGEVRITFTKSFFLLVFLFLLTTHLHYKIKGEEGIGIGLLILSLTLAAHFLGLLPRVAILFCTLMFWILLFAVPLALFFLFFTFSPGMYLQYAGLSFLGTVVALISRKGLGFLNTVWVFLFGLLSSLVFVLEGTIHALSGIICTTVLLICLYRNEKAFQLFLYIWWGVVCFALLHPIYLFPGNALFLQTNALCFFMGYSLMAWRAKWFSPSTLKTFPFYSCALLFLNLVVVTYGLSAYTGGGYLERKKIFSQKEIHPVRLYHPFFHNLHGQEVRIPFESCDGKSLFLVSHASWPKEPLGILQVDLVTGHVVRFAKLGLAVFINQVYQNCKEGVFYYTSYKERKVFAIREKDLKALHTYFTDPRCETLDSVTVEESQSLVFVTDDSVGCLQIFKKFIPFPFFVHPGIGSGPVIFDKDRSFLVPFTYQVRRFSFQKNRLKMLTSVYVKDHMSIAGGFQYDEKTKTVMTSGLLSGGILFSKEKGVFKNLDKRSFVYLGPFLRYTFFDKTRRLLFATGFFSGNLYVVDVDKRRVVKQFFIGRRNHGMTLSRDGNRLYFASSQGVFYLNILDVVGPYSAK